MPLVREIAAWLDDRLTVEQCGEPGNGVVVGEEVTARRIGLALETSADLGRWAERCGLDAVLLHRSWGVEDAALPPGVAVLAYHRPLDQHLTLGPNPLLAGALRIRAVQPFGTRGARVVGMLGRVDPLRFAALVELVRREFGGLEAVIPPRAEPVRCVAVVGAMDDALVREAAGRGAEAYLTGQIRSPARRAVAQTGIGVIEVGHRRSELWALRALGALLRQRWPELTLVVDGEGEGS